MIYFLLFLYSSFLWPILWWLIVLGPDAMGSAQYVKCSVQCLVTSLKWLCAYCSIQYEMWNVPIAVFSVKCDQCAVCSVYCVACSLKVYPLSISDKSPFQGKHHAADGTHCWCRNSSDLPWIPEEFEINKCKGPRMFMHYHSCITPKGWTSVKN